jgi:hypothetical protein
MSGSHKKRPVQTPAGARELDTVLASGQPKGDTDFAAGSFFTSLIRKHDWPPGWTPTIRVDPKTKRFETNFAAAQRNRQNGGWDSHPCIMPASGKSPMPQMMTGKGKS